MTSTLELLVDGKLFSGWKSATFTTDMEAISSTFYVDARDDENVLSGLTAGVPCVAYAINGDRKDQLLDGYITQRRRAMNATAHTISIAGNDKLVDTVDCSIVRENRSWTEKRFSRIVKDLVEPFAVTVDIADLMDDPIIEKLTVQSGESPFAAVERLCRSQAILPLCSLESKLLLTYSASDMDRASVNLVLGENIKAITDDVDWNERFSEYTALGQAAGNGKRWTKTMLQGKAVATDEGMTRYRPRLFIAESRSNNEELTKRVAWEAQIRAGRAAQQQVTVQGWYQKNVHGELFGLWEKNKRVTLKIPEWDIDEEKLITSVSFTLDSNGEQTVLGLRHPDIYKQDPTLKVDLI